MLRKFARMWYSQIRRKKYWIHVGYPEPIYKECLIFAPSLFMAGGRQETCCVGRGCVGWEPGETNCPRVHYRHHPPWWSWWWSSSSSYLHHHHHHHLTSWSWWSQTLSYVTFWAQSDDYRTILGKLITPHTTLGQEEGDKRKLFFLASRCYHI